MRMGSHIRGRLTSVLATVMLLPALLALQVTPSSTAFAGTLAAPSAPTLQSVTPACDGTTSGIQLQWSSSSGATSYEIYRNYSLIYTTATAGTTFWNVSGLA